ncbi:MAG: enoyl-CoA hydratase/isomerase family protein, partial [Planctomycetes bacterium]|nr:enoyl-CoA hydratase/isomerase family protein [Planctomycetota bacterium]
MRPIAARPAESFEFREILYAKQEFVATITINRPGSLNALCTAILPELIAAFTDAANDDAIAVIVLTGAGDRAFCAGGDVRWLQEVQREDARAPAPVDPHAGIED